MECNKFPKSLLEGNKLENNRNKFSFNEGLISQNKTYHELIIRSILFSKEYQDDIKSDDKYLKSTFKNNAFTNIIFGITLFKLPLLMKFIFRYNAKDILF